MTTNRPKEPTPRIIESDGRRRLNERLRPEFIAGAEEEWRKKTGRPVTAEELETVLRRYPVTYRPNPPTR